MIISKIIGGLGNQLFCYAFAKTLSNELNQELKLDLSFFSKYHNPDVYRLHQYCINDKIATEDEIEKVCRKDIDSYINKVLKKLTKRYFFLNNKYHIDEKSFEYDKNKIGKRDHLYLTGYWAQPRLFQHNRDNLVKYFKLKTEINNDNKSLLNEIKNTCSVAVHVRRGDYINNPYFVNLPLEYYSTAIANIMRKLSNPMFYFFSDDISWGSKYFSHLPNAYFVNINDSSNDYMELELMRNCQNFIIANSTFSWWAAWLSDQSTKNIIMPRNWFTNKARQLRFENSGLIQDKWITL